MLDHVIPYHFTVVLSRKHLESSILKMEAGLSWYPPEVILSSANLPFVFIYFSLVVLAQDCQNMYIYNHGLTPNVRQFSSKLFVDLYFVFSSFRIFTKISLMISTYFCIYFIHLQAIYGQTLSIISLVLSSFQDLKHENYF